MIYTEKQREKGQKQKKKNKVVKRQWLYRQTSFFRTLFGHAVVAMLVRFWRSHKKVPQSTAQIHYPLWLLLFTGIDKETGWHFIVEPWLTRVYRERQHIQSPNPANTETVRR